MYSMESSRERLMYEQRRIGSNDHNRVTRAMMKKVIPDLRLGATLRILQAVKSSVIGAAGLISDFDY